MRLVLALALLSMAAGCTRASWTGPIATATPVSFGAVPTDAESRPPAVPPTVTVHQPGLGDIVSPPVRVKASVPKPGERRVVAVVSHLADDGTVRWAGTAALDPSAGGQYAGRVQYSLASTKGGFVDVLLVDPSDGYVVARDRVTVTLSAAP
jgi:hypothetical protein